MPWTWSWISRAARTGSTSGIDAADHAASDGDPSQVGDQAFTFLGAAEFSFAAGELRAASEGPDAVVQADTAGDGEADFALRLLGRIDLSADDFAL